MQYIPRLSWLNAKTRKTCFGSRSGISGHLPEHTEALVENASRTFAVEFNKAMEKMPESPVENEIL